jgi:Fic family protein
VKLPPIQTKMSRIADGNGRMGRLWQMLILAKWDAVFVWIPMEPVIHENRPKYYEDISVLRTVYQAYPSQGP